MYNVSVGVDKSGCLWYSVDSRELPRQEKGEKNEEV